MRKLIYFILASLIAGLAACDDTSTTIGSSLVEDKVEIVMDSSFTLTGRSVLNPRVQSRTTMQLIGSIHADGFGNLSSEIVTQFMPGLVLDASSFTENEIDSVKLVMQMTRGAFTGDSLLPMGLTVYPLTRQLPSPIYSDFDAADYYDPSNVWGSTVYTATSLGRPDSIQALSTCNIEVMLPRQFALDMYRQYTTSPETFQTPQSFAAWFPGLYIANSFGRGRVTRIDKSYITMFYHVNGKSDKTGNDTTFYYANTYLAVTPEVVTNNDIDYTMAPELTARADAGEALLVAPTGYDVELEFPAEEVMDYYRRNSGKVAMLNALTMEIPVEEINNGYEIDPPAYVLLVKTSELDNFFAKNMINDGISSFYAVYDANSRRYIFSDMRGYINDLLEKDQVKPEDTRFTITPVTLTTESSATSGYFGSSSAVVTSIVPYVTNPVMARLRLDKAKIKLTFSKQTMSL